MTASQVASARSEIQSTPQTTARSEYLTYGFTGIVSVLAMSGVVAWIRKRDAKLTADSSFHGNLKH